MHRYTLTVSKLGDLAFLGHRDWARTFERALRRAGLPLVMTEGFHPHPKLQLPEPLPLGVGSEGERFVILLREPWETERLREAVQACLPPGMELGAVEEGGHREPLDLPVELLLQGGDPAAVARGVESLAGGESLGLQELSHSTGPDGLTVHLVPPAGRRVSIGRFLRALREVEAGPAEVRRCIPGLRS